MGQHRRRHLVRRQLLRRRKPFLHLGSQSRVGGRADGSTVVGAGSPRSRHPSPTEATEAQPRSPGFSSQRPPTLERESLRTSPTCRGSTPPAALDRRARAGGRRGSPAARGLHGDVLLLHGRERRGRRRLEHHDGRRHRRLSADVRPVADPAPGERSRCNFFPARDHGTGSPWTL